MASDAQRDSRTGQPDKKLTMLLFGTPRITCGQAQLDIDTKKAIALLVHLVMLPGEHSREMLASHLWSGDDPARNRSALRRTLSTLRKALASIDAPDLLTTRKTIAAPSDAIYVDVLHFRELLTITDDTRPSLATIQKALTLYEAPFLEGFYLQESTPFETWCHELSQQVQDRRLQALQWWMDHCEEQSDWHQAIALAQQWLKIDPYNESIHQQLIRWFVNNGQRTAALQQYEQCRQQLAQGLGVKPSGTTRQLLNALQRQHTAPTTIEPTKGTTKGVATESTRATKAEANERISATTPIVAAASESLQRDNAAPGIAAPGIASSDHTLAQRQGQPDDLLPSPPLLGRNEERQALLLMINDPTCRWITIKGPFGIGKSHLARDLAETISQRPQQHVVWELPLDQKGLLVERERLQQMASAEQMVKDDETPGLWLYLEETPERPASDLVAWLQSIPELRILMTSRSQSHIRGEWVYELQELPGHTQSPLWRQSPAASFLTWYAQKQQYDFALQPEDQAAFGQLYQCLGGYPLGLQMAASWLHVLPIQDLADELQRDLSMLEAPQERGSVSLQQLFGELWATLAPPAQALCRQMASAPTTEASAGMKTQAWLALPGASLDWLLYLCDHSWLQRLPQERFALWPWMASCIRQWG